MPASPKAKPTLVHSRKDPLANWSRDSTRDLTKIEHMWRRHPDALVAIDHGKSGTIAIDVDRPSLQQPDRIDSVTRFYKLCRDNGTEPEKLTTLRVASAGDGEHYIFRNDPDDPLGCSPGQLPKGSSVQGKGGYTIAAGSVYPDGRAYRLFEPGEPHHADDLSVIPPADKLPLMPEWLQAIIKAKGRHVHTLAPHKANGQKNSGVREFRSLPLP